MRRSYVYLSSARCLQELERAVKGRKQVNVSQCSYVCSSFIDHWSEKCACIRVGNALQRDRKSMSPIESLCTEFHAMLLSFVLFFYPVPFCMWPYVCKRYKWNSFFFSKRKKPPTGSKTMKLSDCNFFSHCCYFNFKLIKGLRLLLPLTVDSVKVNSFICFHS